MIEWKYLWSEAFKSRSVLAAYFVRNCKHIVEIGGYKTPISSFLSPDKKVLVLDPRTDPYSSENINHIQIGFEQWNDIVDEPYGVVILGIELHMDELAWQKLYKLIEGSEVAVIEVPIEHIHSVNQFNKILQNVSKRVSTKILLDLSDNNFGDLENSAPPKTLRQINVLSNV